MNGQVIWFGISNVSHVSNGNNIWNNKQPHSNIVAICDLSSTKSYSTRMRQFQTFHWNSKRIEICVQFIVSFETFTRKAIEEMHVKSHETQNFIIKMNTQNVLLFKWNTLQRLKSGQTNTKTTLSVQFSSKCSSFDAHLLLQHSRACQLDDILRKFLLHTTNTHSHLYIISQSHRTLFRI